MKTLLKTLPVLATFAAVVVAPHVASAAMGSKQWSVTVSPTTTNVTFGVASNVAATVTVKEGSALGAATNGVLLSVSVSPSGQGVTAGLDFTGPFTGTAPAPTTLRITNTALAPAQTYNVTVLSTSTFSGSSEFSDSSNITFVVAGPGPGPTRLWTNGGVNLNWSTAANWTPNLVPASTNDVQFNDTAGVGASGTVDNTVDASFTIGSLTYGQTNNFHTTSIGSGNTLSIVGAKGLSAGTGTDAGDGIQTVNTVTGAGGTLVVSNTTATITVDQSHPVSGTGNSSTTATLDLSRLDTFNATVSRLLVGVDTSQALRGACGVLDLAKTNMITATPGAAAPQIDVGDNTQAGGSPALPSVLSLGQTNAFFVDSIAVGRGKANTTGGPVLLFNSSFANPVAYFRGTNGSASRVGTWSIGDGDGSKTSQNFGTNDFSLGTIDAMVNTMYVGRGGSGNGAASVVGVGTLIVGAGAINLNTLVVGTNGDVGGIGTVMLTGGSLSVNTLFVLGSGLGSSGTLSLANATLTADSGISAGVGTNVITLNNSVLTATNGTATIGTSGAAIALFAVTNSTLQLAAQNGTPSASVSTLACDGANTINISSIPVITRLPAQFPLIDYATGAGNLASFNVGTWPAASPAYAGYISNNIANSSIDLVVTSGPTVPPLIWDGLANGNWDTTALNWRTNGVLTAYQQGYLFVQFDDSLRGTSTINLTTVLTPGNLQVNNSVANYTFTGSGKLSGATSLIKLGTASLTLAESGGDDFIGGIKVNGGTLQVGNGGTTGTPAQGNVTVDSSARLVFNRSDNLAVTNPISGAGTVVQGGAGVLALNGNNSTLSGSLVVSQGTLQPGSVAAMGSGANSVFVTNLGTLEVNGLAFNDAQPVTVSGPGVGGNGAIINSVTNQTKVLRVVTLAGNTTLGGDFDWDIHATQSGNTIQNDASLSTLVSDLTLTKVGSNTITLFQVAVDNGLGDIALTAGTLSIERNTTSIGDSSRTITVSSNATFQLNQEANVLSKNITLLDGANFRSVNSNEFAGPISLPGGTGTFVVGNGARLILDSAFSGAGTLAKSGSSSLVLTAPGAYTGSTLINAGSLTLFGSGSIDSSTNISISSGASLDLSLLSDPTLTVPSGHFLQGGGTVYGQVIMNSGSTLSVNGSGTNPVATLTITNALTLQSGCTNLLQVSKVGGTIANDQVVTPSLTYGGTLNVTGLGGAYVAGDTFKLFTATTYLNSFNSVNLPVGVNWDISRLGIDGTIRVISVTPPQISSVAMTNGMAQLAFSGPAGASYRVWASTNLTATPITNTWTLLVTNAVFGTSGMATFLDVAATNYPARFYLISVP